MPTILQIGAADAGLKGRQRRPQDLAAGQRSWRPDGVHAEGAGPLHRPLARDESRAGRGPAARGAPPCAARAWAGLLGRHGGQPGRHRHRHVLRRRRSSLLKEFASRSTSPRRSPRVVADHDQNTTSAAGRSWNQDAAPDSRQRRRADTFQPIRAGRVSPENATSGSSPAAGASTTCLAKSASTARRRRLVQSSPALTFRLSRRLVDLIGPSG